RGLGPLSSETQRAAQAETSFAVAMTGAATAAGRLRPAIEGANRQTRAQIAEAVAASREAANYARSLDEIRARYNPLFAASRIYEQELRDIADAERMGAISAVEAAQARERAAAAMAPIGRD